MRCCNSRYLPVKWKRSCCCPLSEYWLSQASASFIFPVSFRRSSEQDWNPPCWVWAWAWELVESVTSLIMQEKEPKLLEWRLHARLGDTQKHTDIQIKCAFCWLGELRYFQLQHDYGGCYDDDVVVDATATADDGDYYYYCWPLHTWIRPIISWMCNSSFCLRHLQRALLFAATALWLMKQNWPSPPIFRFSLSFYLYLYLISSNRSPF